MRVFKTRWLNRWARKIGLDDAMLYAAAMEAHAGSFEANLGGGVIKKRIALAGRGKSGGARTIIVHHSGTHLFFVYGFAKNERSNIDPGELDAFKLLSRELLGYTAQQLELACSATELIEVHHDEQDSRNNP